MKKIFSILTVCVLAVSMFAITPVHAQSQEGIVQWMYDNNYSIFDTVDGFGRARTVTRGEISKFMLTFAEAQNKGKVRTTEECQFDDLDGYDYTLVPTIIAACEYGIVKGFEGNYMPNNLVTEAELITMMVRIFMGEYEETGSPRWGKYHDTAVWAGIYDESKNVWDLDTPALRGTAATWLYRGESVDGDQLREEGSAELKAILDEVFGESFWDL